MKKYISIDNLIQNAKDKGLDFGKGDPYNRLRYYTKIGWLPHMIRKKGERDEVVGHYPMWVLDRLLLIEDLKDKDYTNEEISKKIQTSNTYQNFWSTINTTENKLRVMGIFLLGLLLFVIMSEFGVINITTSNKQNITINPEVNVIIQSGKAYVPAQQRTLFIKADKASETSKIYITFEGNYAPAYRFWIKDITTGQGFTLELDAPVAQNSPFNWWITN